MTIDRPATQGRTWIVAHYASAPDRPTGSRHFDLARGLVRHGHATTVFAAGFGHATGREERLSGGRICRSEMFDGIEFAWLRTLPYHGNGLRRRLNMLSFLAVFVVVQTRFRRPSVIVGSTVHPFAALGAWVAAKLRGARFILEIGDLWPQTLVDLGAMRIGSPGERLLRSLEAFLVRRASAVITLLPGIRDYLDERGLPSGHVVYIPNGVDLAEFDAHVQAGTQAPETVRRDLGDIEALRADGRFVFGYVGSFGRVNRLDVVVEAASIAERQAPGKVGVVLVGDGPERPELERLAAATPAAVVGPGIPRLYVPAIITALDGTVVHTTATPVYRYGISFNKLFEYMAARRPIVFATESAYDPVAATGAGVTVAPDDPEGLARALLAIASATPAEREAMGAAGRAYVEREHNMAVLADVFEEVVEGRRPASAAS
jgi:glycosyltransferase involved in cell wall biosynthesis